MSSKGTKRKAAATPTTVAEVKKTKSPKKQAIKLDVIPADDVFLWNLVRCLQDEYKQQWEEEHNKSSPGDPLPNFASAWHNMDRLWEARRNGFLLVCVDGSALPAEPVSHFTRDNFPRWNLPILGFIAAIVSTDDSFVYVISMQTFPEYRRMGVGRALFNALEAHSLERKQDLTNREIDSFRANAHPERILREIVLDPVEGSEPYWRKMGFTRPDIFDTRYSRPLVLPSPT